MLRAVSLGGVLSGPHALARWGGRIPPDAYGHIVQVGHTAPIKRERLHTHYVHHAAMPAAPFGIVPWQQALRHALGRLEIVEAVAVVDGLLHTARSRKLPPASALREDEIRSELMRSSLGRQVLALSDADSESIIESYPRVRLRLLGYDVKIQVRLPSLERLDLLIEEIISLEADGRGHAEPGRYVKDHAKAARSAQTGVIPLRFTFAQIIYHWDLVLSSIEALLARFCPEKLRPRIPPSC
ncbi:hypothetical protein [Pseudoclavibacter sp. 13-3]|uniref:hypothetical protein n=1 Tax=Pseudoclavibacter sp. 13-3 TaxID=2901228 RepID=UPI001E3E67C1|nr:hypothetical protein [Pseudoclavibacter sp. 13-3]MCD7102217.1 hypothetical protein [Pseudoclavibacter sp. 13-3]